ncbi:MAG: PTS sugar transporter subunit IIC, partial [Bacilli bacterium]
IVSAILGPIATVVFKLQTTSVGAGMGTSGLVGPIDTFAAMNSTASEVSLNSILGIGLLMFVAPIILVWIIDVLFRKYGLIAKGDLEV